MTIPTARLPDLVIIYRGLPAADVCAATEALLTVGVTAFETTVDSPDAFQTITVLSKRFGHVAQIGAGTVCDVDQVRAAADAGATFLLSPHLDEDVVAATKHAGLLSVPGAYTPTEVVRAHAAGADIVKIFPVGPVGVSHIEQLRQPLPHIPMLATGGVTATLGRQCLAAGCATVGVGAGLIDSAATRDRNWSRLAARAAAFVTLLRGE